LAVDAYAQDEGYWHLFVALRLVGGKSLVFTTEERSAGARFEVFPIAAQHQPVGVHSWRVLPNVINVKSAYPLWRNEWIESGATGPTVGESPATQYAGRGPASTGAVASARVLAGVLLLGECGEQLVISSSDSAPFNVEIYLPGEPAKAALEGFEPVAPNPSIERTASSGLRPPPAAAHVERYAP